MYGASHAQSTQNNKFAISLQYLKKNVKDETDFFMCVIRRAQIRQNNKFAISLQYLEKEVSDKADFLHADKCQIFLQVNFSLQYLYNIWKKKLGMEFILLYVDMRQSFFKLVLSFLMDVARHGKGVDSFWREGSGFLEVAITNFISQLLFHLIKVQTERCCIIW